MSGGAHEAAHALHDDVDSAAVAVGAGLTEPGGGGVDEPRVDLLEVFVAEAEAFHRSGREVLRKDVGFLHEAVDDLLRLGGLEVQHDALLAAVDREEVGADVVDVGAVASTLLVLVDGLDLPDVCAEVGELHDAVGAGEGPCEVEHGDSVEWSWHLGHPSVA